MIGVNNIAYNSFVFQKYLEQNHYQKIKRTIPTTSDRSPMRNNRNFKEKGVFCNTRNHGGSKEKAKQIYKAPVLGQLIFPR